MFDRLYPFQQEAVEFAINRSGAAIFAEQGCGKTWIAGGIVSRLGHSEFRGLVVVPLANVETTWAKMFRDQLPELPVYRSWRTWEKAPRQVGVLLLHYEALNSIPKNQHRKLFKSHWDVVIYDESQRLKSRGTKQSRNAAKFSDVDHRVILSGTPIEQCPQDLWAQFRFALPEVFGTRWSDFDSTWLVPTGYMGYDRKFKWNLLPQFLELIRPHMIRVTKQEVLDLPPITYHACPVWLLGDQDRVYRELEKDMVATVDGEELIADMAITQLVRLQQICGGFVRTTTGIRTVGTAKLRKAVHLVTRERKPIVIFCKYLEEIDQLSNALSSYRVAVIDGRTRKDRTSTIERFQAGAVDVLICQERTGGVGIDLFAASVVILYSITYSSIDLDQAISRVHRHGQTKPVKVFAIYSRNSVDEEIRKLIIDKQLVVKKILSRRTMMATLKKAEKAPAAEKPAKDDAPKYSVSQLAADLGIKEASVRVKLRNAEVPKAGKSYGWSNKKDYEEVLKQLKASGKKEEKAA